MNKRELIKVVARKNGILQAKAAPIVASVFETLGNCIIEKEPVTLLGFGTFYVRERKERVGVNPISKKKMTIPAKKVVKFSLSKNLKIK